MKRTITVPFRAAYDVSRLLFTALSDGCEQIEKQHEQIKLARDKIQTIHVNQQPKEFDQLLQSILESCCLSLQTHVSIFEAVVETIKVEPGQEVSKSYDQFFETIGKFKEAVKGVERCQESTKQNNVSASPLSSSSSSSSASDSDSGPEVQKSTKLNTTNAEESTSHKNIKTEHVPSDELPSVHVSSPEKSQDKVMKGKGKKLSKPSKASKPPKEQPSFKETANVAPAQNNSEDPIEDAVPEPEVTEPEKPATPKVERQLSFEDISAEVNARLAAKAEKRKSKKEGKKRKRESVASDIFSPDPKGTPEQAKVVQPKKKVKTLQDEPKVESKRRAEESDVLGRGKRIKTQPRESAGVQAAEPSLRTDSKMQPANKKANKSKRRRSSGPSEPQAPVPQRATNDSGFHRKKRKIGI